MITYFLKLIRWPNLLMTIAAIWMHWFCLIYLPLRAHQLEPQIDQSGIIFLGIAFAFVMGAGYVINDIFDLNIDANNKGQSQILIHRVSIGTAKKYYWFLNISALLLSTSLAIIYDQLKYLILLPLGVGLLYFYSSHLKKKAFIGNLIIAILCGTVLLLPFWVESEQLKTIDPAFYISIRNRFMICFSLATLLSLIRELIKDQQDIYGDRIGNAHTLPIIWGIKNTDSLIRLLTGLSLVLVIFSIRFVDTAAIISMILMTCLILTLVALFLIMSFKSYADQYSLKSKYLKVIMLLGMIILPIVLKTTLL